MLTPPPVPQNSAPAGRSAGSSADGPPSWPWPPLPCPCFPAACSPGNPGQSSGAGIQGLGLSPSPLAFLPFPVRNFSPLSLVTITPVGPGPSAQCCVPRAQKAGLGPRRAGTCAGPARGGWLLARSGWASGPGGQSFRVGRWLSLSPKGGPRACFAVKREGRAGAVFPACFCLVLLW